MSAGEAIIALATGLSVFGFALIALIVCGALVTRSLHRVGPELRALLIMLLAGAPYAFGAFTALGVVLFPHASPLDLSPAHHHDGLVDCTSCGTLAGVGVGAWLTLLIVLSLSLRIGQIALVRLMEMHRLRQVLERASTQMETDLRFVAIERPLALAVGLFRPSVFISRSMVEHVGPEGRAIVEAHERAHLARGDLIARFIMDLFCSLYPKHVAVTLRSALVLAQEQACDAFITKRYTPVRVAETLIQLEKSHLSGSSLSVAFQDADIALRVRALLEPNFEAFARSLVRICALGAFLLLLVFVALEPLHHKIETLLLFLDEPRQLLFDK